MICNHLKPHVHSCLIHPGRAIALDFFFKSNIKLRIISVYLSSTDSTKRNDTQNTVIDWIKSARHLNLHPIILGDFNTQDSIHSSSNKYKLINFLNHSNMYNIGAHFDNTHHTWSNNSSSSRIDYIWTDQSTIQFLLSYNLDSNNTSTLSDHLILLSSWTFPNTLSKFPRHHTDISHRVFNYKAIESDKWTEFSDLLTSKLNLHNTPLTTHSHETL